MFIRSVIVFVVMGALCLGGCSLQDATQSAESAAGRAADDAANKAAAEATAKPQQAADKTTAQATQGAERAANNAADKTVAAVESAPIRAEAKKFLDTYNKRYRELTAAAEEAKWASDTHIVEGDDTNAKRTQATSEAKAAFAGSIENIETARRLLAQEKHLEPLQVLQLKRVLFLAAGAPQTVADTVKARIKAETAQSEKLFGFKFMLEGKEITPNDIDSQLEKETDLTKRRAVWEASKTVGPPLREGLIELRRLRNECVRALGYKDFFAYKASEYGTTTEELTALADKFNRELRPLYRELHTWMRYELAKRYGQPVPDVIPAHWLPNRWGQDWAAVVQVEGFDLDAALKQKTPEWLVKQAESFYVSLGFEPLPAVFYEKSSLYPVPVNAGFKKNTHASAWHIDLDRDVRSLMSVEPNARWYDTTHHELGHIYYYLCYSTPEVPILLREGANRAYHEAIGTLMGMVAMQPRFVARAGLGGNDAQVDSTQLLLQQALDKIVFIPWSMGTMTMFEKELYADELSPEQWNKRWWELVAHYQGIAPPEPRDERYCDPATKTHINDDPAEYYDYGFSFVLLFQIHDYISRKILSEDPHDALYYGRRDVGHFLRTLLAKGATVDGNELLRQTIGEDMSARAVLAYFEPVQKWLAEQNKGRKHTLPEL